MKKHPGLVGVVSGIVGALLVGIAVWLTIVYTGAYNVAASEQHFDVARWTLNTTLRRSMANRAGGVNLPENASEDLLAEGAGHYADSCAYCPAGRAGIRLNGPGACGQNRRTSQNAPLNGRTRRSTGSSPTASK